MKQMLSDLEHKILTLLAKRSNKNYNNISHIPYEGWYLYEGWFTCSNMMDTCLICEKKMHVSETYEHGLKHLKDSNLLVFI